MHACSPCALTLSHGPPHLRPCCTGFALQDLSPQSRADGQLQRYGQELLWQVPFEALQAQVRGGWVWVAVGWMGGLMHGKE
jgi:hypothetical protein